jgi:hypothetical protein
MIVLHFGPRLVGRPRRPQDIGPVMGAKTDQIFGRAKHALGAITGDKKMKRKGQLLSRI